MLWDGDGLYLERHLRPQGVRRIGNLQQNPHSYVRHCILGCQLSGGCPKASCCQDQARNEHWSHSCNSAFLDNLEYFASCIV